MQFFCKIKCDNEAFSEYPATELARLLRKVASRIEGGEEAGFCIDTNGNLVGRWDVTGERP